MTNENNETQNSETQQPTTPPAGEAAGAVSEKANDTALTAEAPAPFDLEKFSVPENFTLSDEVKTELGEFAKKHGLSHAAVEDLAKIHFRELTAASERISGSVADQWTATQDQWRGQLKSMYGSDEKIIESAGQLAGIVDRFGGQEFREALEVTGMGNHPAMFKFLEAVKKTVGEATPVSATAAPKSINLAEALYPNSPKLHRKE